MRSPRSPRATAGASRSTYTYNGDANVDGLINADDYFLIDQAFLGQGTALTSSGSEGPLFATTAVPEPTVALVAMTAGCLLLRRRRR